LELSAWFHSRCDLGGILTQESGSDSSCYSQNSLFARFSNFCSSFVSFLRGLCWDLNRHGLRNRGCRFSRTHSLNSGLFFWDLLECESARPRFWCWWRRYLAFSRRLEELCLSWGTVSAHSSRLLLPLPDFTQLGLPPSIRPSLSNDAGLFERTGLSLACSHTTLHQHRLCQIRSRDFSACWCWISRMIGLQRFDWRAAKFLLSCCRSCWNWSWTWSTCHSRFTADIKQKLSLASGSSLSSYWLWAHAWFPCCRASAQLAARSKFRSSCRVRRSYLFRSLSWLIVDWPPDRPTLAVVASSWSKLDGAISFVFHFYLWLRTLFSSSFTGFASIDPEGTSGPNLLRFRAYA